jgi:hypothetical protein
MARLKRCVIVMVVAGPWQVAVLQLLKSISTLKPTSPLAVGGLGGLEQVDWTEVDSSGPFLVVVVQFFIDFLYIYTIGYKQLVIT